MTYYGLKFLKVHLDGAVAGEKDDVVLLVWRVGFFFSGPVRVSYFCLKTFVHGFMVGWVSGGINGMDCYGCADGCRESVAHGSNAILGDEAGSVLNDIGLAAGYAGGAVANYRYLAGLCHAGNDVHNGVNIGTVLGVVLLCGVFTVRCEVLREDGGVVFSIECAGLEPGEVGGSTANNFLCLCCMANACGILAVYAFAALEQRVVSGDAHLVQLMEQSLEERSCVCMNR